MILTVRGVSEEIKKERVEKDGVSDSFKFSHRTLSPVTDEYYKFLNPGFYFIAFCIYQSIANGMESERCLIPFMEKTETNPSRVALQI